MNILKQISDCKTAKIRTSRKKTGYTVVLLTNLMAFLKKIVLDRLKSTNFRKVIITKLANSRKSNFNIKHEKYILTTILAAESYHATFKAHTNHILTPEDTIGSTSVWKPWLESKLPWQCYFLWLCYLKTLDAVMAFVKKKILLIFTQLLKNFLCTRHCSWHFFLWKKMCLSPTIVSSC